MRVTLARRRQDALLGALGVARLSPRGLVRRQRTALTFGELCFLEFGHVAMAAGVEGEVLRQAEIIARLLHLVLHRGLRKLLAVLLQCDEML